MLLTIIKQGISVFLFPGMLALTSCTAEQGYLTLQDWQNQRCKTVADNAERLSCLEQTNRTYKEYINSDEYKENNS